MWDQLCQPISARAEGGARAWPGSFRRPGRKLQAGAGPRMGPEGGRAAAVAEWRGNERSPPLYQRGRPYIQEQEPLQPTQTRLGHPKA